MEMAASAPTNNGPFVARRSGGVPRAAYHFFDGQKCVPADQMPEVGFHLAWESRRAAFYLIRGAEGSRTWCAKCAGELPLIEARQ
jgi:hypothetical protein